MNEHFSAQDSPAFLGFCSQTKSRSCLILSSSYHFLSYLVQVLHLSHNPLISLAQETFLRMNMINLQKVYLNNCSLQTVDKTAFRSLTLMIELDLSDNKVTLKSKKFRRLL